MRRKKLLEITLCAVLMIGALLCCMQDASARETLLISGNADLYPIESYDRGRECYVGLLPELYERLSEQTGYDLVYLPYSKNTTQAQQTARRTLFPPIPPARSTAARCAVKCCSAR